MSYALRRPWPPLAGPAWLTGATAGPEGSILAFLALGAVMLLCRGAFRPPRQAQE